MPTVSEQTQMEMERGRLIGQRKERQRDLDRLVEAKKVSIMVALPGHAYYEPKGRVNIFHVDGVAVAHQNIMADDYPSEGVMAVLLLSVGSTVGTDGVAPVESAWVGREDEHAARVAYRDKHLGQWRQHNGEG